VRFLVHAAPDVVRGFEHRVRQTMGSRFARELAAAVEAGSEVDAQLRTRIERVVGRRLGPEPRGSRGHARRTPETGRGTK
jgi:hypothetical protein